MNVDALALIVNGAVTCTCGGCILYSIYARKIEKHRFYFLFGFGFVIYGIEILLRTFYPEYLFYSVLMLYCALIFFIIGLWSFSRKKSFLAIIIAIYIMALSMTLAWKLDILTGFLRQIGSQLGSLVYFPIVMLIIYHRLNFGRIADKFVFGWFLLFLANFATFGMGWITDFFAIFSKLVLLWGIHEYDFIILAERIREETLLKSLPTDTGYGKEGGLKLIITKHSSYLGKVKWMEKAALQNIKSRINTYIFSFQDVIPHRELRRIKWIDPERIFIFQFSASAEKTKQEFAVLPMGITQIGAALSQVIKERSNLEEGIVIFFTDLSLLIHLFGVDPVYNMLLNKMGSLREGGVQLFAFFHPETHSDKSVVSLFKNIADAVVT